MKNLRQKIFNKLLAITKINFQFFIIRKMKIKEKDGLILYGK